MKASCRWCHAVLVLMDGCWWCPTPACTKRQVDHSVSLPPRGKIPRRWLYVPTPIQVMIDACPAKYLLGGGSAGPGKSHGGRWRMYRRALRIAGYEGLLIRKTFPELEKTHLRRMAADAELYDRCLGAEFIESKRLMRFSNGSLIECGHMEDAEAVAKYLSSEYDDITVDEGSTIDPFALLELSTRARTSKPAVLAEGGAKFIVLSNPGGPSAPLLLDLFIDHQPDFEVYPALRDVYDPAEWVYLAASLDDNPYIDQAYVRQLAVLPKWRYDQLRYGDWRVFSGQFFHTFNERRHVKDLGTPEGAKWFRSMDWGFNKPGCWLWWAVLPDHRVYVRRDYKFHGESVQANAVEVKKHTTALGLPRMSYDVGDPSIWIKTGNTTTGKYIGQSIGETFSKFGITIGRADHDRYNGWMRVHDCLRDAPDGDPWLVIHPDARYLIRSLAAAKSDEKDPDDVDTDSDDHALDALRYGVMSRPGPNAKPSKSRRYPVGTMGALRQQSTPRSTGLGEESVRYAHA